MNNDIKTMNLNLKIEVIKQLYCKYLLENNSYALHRIECHLSNLPDLIYNENKKNDDKIAKHDKLVSDQKIFTNIFLSENKFYYMPYHDKYYEYDGYNYSIVSEDVIYHRLLSKITNDQQLFQWKYKTKINIIKKIKNTSIFKSIPEPETIQSVLTFLRTICHSDEESIYLLCVLGDCILKKNKKNQFFIKLNFKHFINLIDNIICITCGYSILNNFVLKCHDTHHKNNYRLIDTKTIISHDVNKKYINDNGLNLICVVTYFSNLYDNSDNYIYTLDENISNYVLFFVKNTPDEIVNNFISECIEFLVPISSTQNEDEDGWLANLKTKTLETKTKEIETVGINWKNMHYIWKTYLHNIKIPSFLCISELQNMLMLKINRELLQNNEIYFKNITSKYLPNIQSFISFWNENITLHESNFNYDYKIIEIIRLYKNSRHKIGHLDINNVLRIIEHYFSPNVVVIDGKYIKNIKCKLWDKDEEIKIFLNLYKYTLLCHSNYKMNEQNIKIDKLYDEYKKQNTIDKYLIIGYDYFKKYILNNLGQYIDYCDGNSINVRWIES